MNCPSVFELQQIAQEQAKIFMNSHIARTVLSAEARAGNNRTPNLCESLQSKQLEKQLQIERRREQNREAQRRFRQRARAEAALVSAPANRTQPLRYIMVHLLFYILEVVTILFWVQ
jgi:hypothetical protein